MRACLRDCSKYACEKQWTVRSHLKYALEDLQQEDWFEEHRTLNQYQFL